MLIGGTEYFGLDSDLQTLHVGMMSHCLQDLHLSLTGPKFLSECSKLGKKIDIAYMGTQTVEVEVIKKVVLIEFRGDTLPDHEKDMIVVHLGGLPADMVEGAKHRQFVRGVTARLPQTKTKEFEMKGRQRNKFKHERQIIHLGISHICGGELSLRDIGNKKLVQCVETLGEGVAGDQGSQQVNNTEISQIGRKVPRKNRKKYNVFRIPGSGNSNGMSKNATNTTDELDGISGQELTGQMNIVTVDVDGYEDGLTNNVPAKDPSRADVVDIGTGSRELVEIEGVREADSEEDIKGMGDILIEIKDKNSVNVRVKTIDTEVDITDKFGNTKDETDVEVKHYVVDVGDDENSGEQEVIKLTGTKKKKKTGIKEGNEIVIEIRDKKPATITSNEIPPLDNDVGSKVKGQAEIVIEISDKKPVTFPQHTNNLPKGPSTHGISGITHKPTSELSGNIEGHIFEIHEATYVKARDKGHYVEVGLGKACSSMMRVRFVGSSLECICEGKTVRMVYIGEGATDVEVTHTTFMVDGEEWDSYQSEDHVLMYVGGIPNKLRNENTKSVVINGVTAHTNREDRIVEIVGQGPTMKRYQRQIVVMGISRTCDDYLFTTTLSGKTIVECAKVNHEKLHYVGQEVS